MEPQGTLLDHEECFERYHVNIKIETSFFPKEANGIVK
jgi:hypothetical protein